MLLVIPPRVECLSRAAYDELLAFVVAYADLLGARWEAQDRHHPGRASPVPLSSLRDKGVPEDLLVWLLYQAHVEHFQQAANGDDGKPDTVIRTGVLLSPSSCFALTNLGEAFATQFLDNILAPPEEMAFAEAWGKLILGQLTPRYDKDDRVFSWCAYRKRHRPAGFIGKRVRRRRWRVAG